MRRRRSLTIRAAHAFRGTCKFFRGSIGSRSVTAVLFDDAPGKRNRDAVPASEREQFVGLAFVLDLRIRHFSETPEATRSCVTLICVLEMEHFWLKSQRELISGFFVSVPS